MNKKEKTLIVVLGPTGVGKTELAKTLAENEEKIVAELAQVQGKPADIGGYYAIDPTKVNAVMRPSATFNAALATVEA